MLLDRFEGVIGSYTYDLIAYIVPRAVSGGAGLCFALMAVTWVQMGNLYTERLVGLRKGKYFFDRDTARGSLASQYIGYQLVHCIVGYLLIGVVFLFLGVFGVLLALIPPLMTAFDAWLAHLFWLLLPTSVLWLVMRMIGAVLVAPNNRVRNMVRARGCECAPRARV